MKHYNYDSVSGMGVHESFSVLVAGVALEVGGETGFSCPSELAISASRLKALADACWGGVPVRDEAPELSPVPLIEPPILRPLLLRLANMEDGPKTPGPEL